MSEPMPLYRTIAEDLRRQISTGELAPGDRLKSEAELMEAYGRDGKASRNTVRDAIKFLASRGLVETRAGQGTFVAETMQPFLTRLTQDPESAGFEDEVYRSEVQRQGREPVETTPRVEVQPASALIASRLAVDEGTPVISRHQEDRKSTRLNSSHVEISYAVFCLKKKKKKIKIHYSKPMYNKHRETRTRDQNMCGNGK